MQDNQERNKHFFGQHMSFSSVGRDIPYFQNIDMTNSSYFSGMDAVEEISKKRKYFTLDSEDITGLSPIIYGNNHYNDQENLAMGQQAEFVNINKTLLSSLRPTYFQQKEPSLYQETYRDDVSNFRDIEPIGRSRQIGQSGYQSEYGCDVLSTFLLDQDNQQGAMVNPHLPAVVESYSSEKACLERENLKNNAYSSKELEGIYLGKQESLTNGHENQFSAERSLYVNSSLNSEKLSGNIDGLSAIVDEQNKPSNWRLSPVASEKIWDGSLKLNTSITVSAIAFFKSGAKIEDLNWPEHLEVKGKVRLPAFEKFIQELPRSRNRALMVISLCWKVGSSQSGLEGMLEIAKGYKESGKVGFAQIPPGIDLYVCPRSDVIITILAKYGFFKGMAAVEEDQDSLIGCVVWRRGQSSANPVSKPASTPEQPRKLAGSSSQLMNSPTMEGSIAEKKQALPAETEPKSTALNQPNSEGSTGDTKAEPSITTSLHASLPPSILYPLPPAQPTAMILPVGENPAMDKAVLASDSRTQFVSPPQIAPVITQNLGALGSGPGPGPRPLIPVDSSNFQFQPQLVQKAHSSLIDPSPCVKNPASSFQTWPPALPRPPPLPFELLQSFIQSRKDATNSMISKRVLHDELHTATRRSSDVSETSAPSTQHNDVNDGDDDDDDDLPEFDFNSACEEQPEISMSRRGQQARAAFSAPFEPANTKEYLELFQHRIPAKISSKERLSLVQSFGDHPPKATRGAEGRQLLEKDFGSAPRRGTLWDDDDDDMPEWCPPDLDPPEMPPPRATENARPPPPLLRVTENARPLPLPLLRVTENARPRPPRATEKARLRPPRATENARPRSPRATESPRLTPPPRFAESARPPLRLPRAAENAKLAPLLPRPTENARTPPPPFPRVAENARTRPRSRSPSPRSSETARQRPPPRRTLPPPILSFRPSRGEELPQLSQAGLLGPHPSSNAPVSGSARSVKPRLDSRRTDSFRPPAGKPKSRKSPRYDADRRRNRWRKR